MRIRWRGLELPSLQSEVLGVVASRKSVPFLEIAAERPEADAQVAEAVRALKAAGLVSVINEGDELREIVTANIDALVQSEIIER